eukprot:TRINITY_DN2333_c0_g1_i2.p1 TRINITY_DN2333_c0_g1~~TRINITY_DN2333_c0_g1_i2.p1  ORF type:complete len:204 (+),score=27.34 TRINITY_DN2333_c0_g1_i2:60-614(+)
MVSKQQTAVMKHFLAAMMVSFAGDVEALPDREGALVDDCVKKKEEAVFAPCGLNEKHPKPNCTPECEAAVKEASHNLDGSCCSYLRDPVARSQCEDYIKGWAPKMVSFYRRDCSKALGDFNAALVEMRPFGLDSHDENVATVRAAPVKIGLIVVGCSAAGATGACVALAFAYWNARKQDILLAN